MEIKMNVTDVKIEILIPAVNRGKFRFKKRIERTDFGEVFSTRNENFDGTAYLEWQIGYDTTVIDVVNEKKSTYLTKYTFVGANEKEKHPYELSEILFKSLEIGLITKNNINNLQKEIVKYDSFIDESLITVENGLDITIYGLTFQEAITKLPTLFFLKTPDNTQIEVSIQKQQYASGVQPMVYFCIPIEAFRNYKCFMNRTSAPNDNLIYVIDKDNKAILLTLMKVFAMASQRHKIDILKIINLLDD